MLAFTIVVLVAVTGVALIAGQTTATEFRRFTHESGMAFGMMGLPERLAAYYAGRGSWEGVERWLRPGRWMGMDRWGMGMGMDRWEMGMEGMEMMPGGRAGPPIVVADASGRIVADTTGRRTGQRASRAELAAGFPILVGGQQVGTLLVGAASSGSALESQFLARVRRGLIVGGVAALLVALGLGFLLFRQVTAPLGRLAAAADQIAAGNLDVRVEAAGQDELGRVAEAFNRMAVSLAQAERLRRDMTADIAHELRTPLTVIQGNLEAVLDGIYPADAEHLGPVLDKVRLLIRLVEDLRTLSLAEAGELPLHRRPTDLVALARRVAAGFRASAAEKGVAIEVAAAELPPVPVDAGRLEQVLGNLLDNAVRHTPAGGHVTLSLGRDDRGPHRRVRVAVTDTGPGIPPEALPHIFERFYRAERDRARRSGGTGLGLAIVKGIVEAHGGQVWAESAEGRGTTIGFWLPLDRA